jgi:hypothetical protein
MIDFCAYATLYKIDRNDKQTQKKYEHQSNSSQTAHTELIFLCLLLNQGINQKQILI